MQPKDKNDSVQLSTRYLQYTFAKRHLRGTRRPEVFPIGAGNEVNPKQDAQGNDVAHTIQCGDKHRGSYVCEPRPKHGKPIYPMKDCPTIQTHWGTGGNNVALVNAIRRLTPTECERLQGFPDEWTEGVSDTQRYKCLGNAVTVNVVREIIKRII